MKDIDMTKMQQVKELTELRRRIAQLEALEAERRQAEETLLEDERLRVLSQVGIAAAHNINQPLTVVMGQTDLLLTHMGPNAPQRRNLEAILKAGQEISKIVNKMNTARQYVTTPYLEGIDMVDFDSAGQEGIQQRVA